jgi:hypothetical protein
VGLRYQIGNREGDGVAVIFTTVAGEIVAATAVEVAMKESKQISVGLARMSAMLAGKTTPDLATMQHSKFPITPTWGANCQGVRPGQICKGATQEVVG